MKSALANFQTLPLKDAARQLLAKLGYKSDKFLVGAGSKPQDFLNDFAAGHPFDQAKALVPEWKSADLLFQLTDQELSRESALFTDDSVQRGLLKSYIFIAIELKGTDYARGKFSAITRQINRLFPMPVMVIFKHGERLTIAVINRRRNKLDDHKDVLEKATLIRDISFANPHRGHLDILASLALPNLAHPKKLPITDFDTLHAAWEQIFNVELLNNRFYKELSNWYFWALPQVEFPADLEPDDEKRSATALIRLLTRLIFCWFLKEKGLIPEKLFHPTDLAKLLKGFDPESETSSTYYQAILQNLFFATLNQRMGKDGNGKPYRRYVTDEDFHGRNKEHGITNLLRYPEHFQQPEETPALFEDIPFLNGGLFECLDREDPDNKNRMLRLDGFTTKGKRPRVPDRLFFDSGETADLSEVYGDKKRKSERVTGLISILNRYKFTIVENTPIDQEIALDPELLGKVFENLLASYNEETKTTARKQTGSFYTPRPIVDYMVDESLKAHLTRCLTEKAGMKEDDAKAGLDLLFTYTEKEHPFSDSQVAALITAIDEVKILDPACGSGAFPMGVLHKLVYILGKLDRDNQRWKQTQLAKLDSAPMREALEAAFQDNNDDYGRKLYLIENCLYGVDIQPIAIQITKLRFFISLVCDQNINRNKKDNHGIRPLPNLETKFVAADTLIGLPLSDKDLFIESLIAPIEKEIEDAYHSHFTIQRRDQKQALQKKIKTLRLKLAETLAGSLGAVNSKKAKHLAEWDPFDPQSTAHFFDPHWMFGRALADGFDIVIGNPPYGAEFTADFRASARSTYETAVGELDSYTLFVERCAKTLAPSGVLSFILPDTWLTLISAETFRRWVLTKTELTQLALLNGLVFQAAVVDTMLLFLRRSGPTETSRTRIVVARKDVVVSDVSELPEASSVNQLVWLTSAQAQIKAFVTPELESLIAKAHAEAVRLDALLDYRAGCKPYEEGKGTPPQTIETLEVKPFTSATRKGKEWLPLLRGNDVQRYAVVSKKPEWINYGKWLAAPRTMAVFSGPRLLIQAIRNPSLKKRIVATWTDETFITRINVYSLLQKPRQQVDLLAVLAILNSQFMNWMLMKDYGLHTYVITGVLALPIKQRAIQGSETTKLRHLAKRIISAKQKDATADTSSLEREIDQQIYSLYGLTPEEIAIVEGTTQ